MKSRYSQETLITMTGHLLQLKLDGNISILQQKCNLNSSFECRIKFIENMSYRTNIGVSSNKTIVAWLNGLSKKNKTFSNLKQITTQFAIIPVMSYSCERAFNKLPTVNSKFRKTTIQRASWFHTC